MKRNDTDTRETKNPDVTGLSPAIISIPAACAYMGNISRAKLYADILPRLETIKIGTRRLVVVASIDKLIAELLP